MDNNNTRCAAAFIHIYIDSPELYPAGRPSDAPLYVLSSSPIISMEPKNRKRNVQKICNGFSGIVQVCKRVENPKKMEDLGREASRFDSFSYFLNHKSLYPMYDSDKWTKMHLFSHRMCIDQMTYIFICFLIVA